MIHFLLVALCVYLALSVLLVAFFFWATSDARGDEQVLTYEERALWDQIERHWQ